MNGYNPISLQGTQLIQNTLSHQRGGSGSNGSGSSISIPRRPSGDRNSSNVMASLLQQQDRSQTQQQQTDVGYGNVNSGSGRSSFIQQQQALQRGIVRTGSGSGGRTNNIGNVPLQMNGQNGLLYTSQAQLQPRRSSQDKFTMNQSPESQPASSSSPPPLPHTFFQQPNSQHPQPPYSNRPQPPSQPNTPMDYGGRRTPEPPKGSYRLQPNEVAQPHPPSAPPALTDRHRLSKVNAAHGYGPMGMMFNAAGENQTTLNRPPQHPATAHPMSYQHRSSTADNPSPAISMTPGHRGSSIQSTIASARSSTYGKLTIQQPPSARMISNSPSPNSTPIKPTFSRFQHEQSAISSPSSLMNSPRQQPQQRRVNTNAPIPIALSWPSDHPTSSTTVAANGHQPPPRAFPSRGSIRNSHPSPYSGPVASGPLSSNFPSIMKRGAQLIDTQPPTLSPLQSAALNDSNDSLNDSNDTEPDDVALLDLVEDDALASQRSQANHARVGSGARANGGGKRGSSTTINGIKKLDLTAAQSFRTPYTRKSFAQPLSAAAPNTGKQSGPKHDVPPACEWNIMDSEPEIDDESESKQSSSDSSSSNGADGSNDDDWILDIGMAEDANPRFRASMEDAHVIRRSFGPEYGIAPSSFSDPNKPVSENKESDSRQPSKLRGSFFAIYDGHGGRAAVDFVARHFHRELAKRLTTSTNQTDIPRAIELAASRVDAAMALMTNSSGQLVGEEFQECGSTACIAYLRPCGPKNQGRELFLANIGDAQAVLGVDKKLAKSLANGPASNGKETKPEKRRKSSAPISHRSSSPAPTIDSQRTPKKSPATARDSTFAKTLARTKVANGPIVAGERKYGFQALSYAHVATDAKEMARIKAAGGCVFANRVNGCLAVTRAFGDHSLKSSGVSCVPYQQHVELTPAHKFLIIGCDGIWVRKDADTTDQCGRTVTQSDHSPFLAVLIVVLQDVMNYKQAVDFVSGMDDAQAMAQKLIDIALKKGTTDNCSCLVVRFRN